MEFIVEMSDAQEKECMFKCGKIIVFDPELPHPPYREKDTGFHHTFQRCYEAKPEDAKQRFADAYKKNNQH